MRGWIRGILVLALGPLACSQTTSGAQSPGDRAPRGSTGRARTVQSCVVPGTETAQALVPVVPAPDCTFEQRGPANAPFVVRDAEGLAGALRCETSAPPSGLDLTTHDLYVVGYSRSPASVGLAALDDGTTVTFVDRFRSPCPDDPRPMPMSGTLAFVLPKGATRTFRSANCTIPPDCR